jgi:flagellar protein FliS
MLQAYAKSQYEEMQVQTTPGRLVVMLYDGALRFLHTALDALRRGDREVQGTALGKAQAIVCELMETLDPDAGEIAHRLDSIYRYCLRRLLVGNSEDRADYIEEVIRLMGSLREAWDQAERSFHEGLHEERTPALVGAGR